MTYDDYAQCFAAAVFTALGVRMLRETARLKERIECAEKDIYEIEKKTREDAAKCKRSPPDCAGVGRRPR